jgi:ABC-type lipoprotein release transport system permease subunit
MGRRLVGAIIGLIIGMYSVMELNKYVFIVAEKDGIRDCSLCDKN